MRDKNRTLGIEWEFYNNGIELTESLWSAGLSHQNTIHGYHCDCSKCDEPRVWSPQDDSTLGEDGVELRSAPVRHTDLESVLAISKVAELAKQNSCRVNNQCGVHVHVYAGDLTPKQLDVLNDLYTECQPTLLKLATGSFQNHRGTEYCAPLSKKEKVLMYPGAPKRYLIREKYWGLNFAPLMSKGTVEFRLWNGTRKSEYMMMYALTSWALVEFSARIGEQNNLTVGDVPPKQTVDVVRGIAELMELDRYFPDYFQVFDRQIRNRDWQQIQGACPRCALLDSECECSSEQIVNSFNLYTTCERCGYLMSRCRCIDGRPPISLDEVEDTVVVFDDDEHDSDYEEESELVGAMPQRGCECNQCEELRRERRERMRARLATVREVTAPSWREEQERLTTRLPTYNIITSTEASTTSTEWRE